MSDKRKRLLESALTLFVDQGFQGTPTSQVANNAGVATGTLFHHFDSKTELIQGVYEYCKAKRVASIELGDNGHSLEQRFKNLFLGRVEWGMSNLTAFTYLARFEKSSFSDAVPTDDQALNDLISEGQMNRKLRLIDEQILRYSVDSLLDSFAAYYSQNPAKHKDQLHLYTSFDFFWTAIKY